MDEAERQKMVHDIEQRIKEKKKQIKGVEGKC